MIKSLINVNGGTVMR